MIATDRRLADIVVETIQRNEEDAAGSPPRLFQRPTGVVLLNDGVWHHWLIPGETYRIRHDGTGWHVTCRSWTGEHTYRLGDLTGTFVSTLPTPNATYQLERGVEYEMRATDLYRWGLFPAAARPR